MKLKPSQILVAGIIGLLIGGYAICVLLKNMAFYRDPLPAVCQSVARDFSGWKPKRVPKLADEPAAIFTVDFDRLARDFPVHTLANAAKEGLGYTVLTGSFRSKGCARITEPFEGVVVELAPTQAPKVNAELYEVLWFVPIQGNENGFFRQYIADNGINVTFNPSDGAAILDWTKPESGKQGTVSVASLRWIKYVVGQTNVHFRLDDPTLNARETERGQIKAKFAEFLKEVSSQPPPSASRLNDIQAAVNQLMARKQALDLQEQNEGD